MFDLRPKIYYMAFEKVTGRPHPALRQRKLRQIDDDGDGEDEEEKEGKSRTMKSAGGRSIHAAFRSLFDGGKKGRQCTQELKRRKGALKGRFQIEQGCSSEDSRSSMKTGDIFYSCEARPMCFSFFF